MKLLAEEGLGGKRSSGMGCLGQVAEEEGFRQLAAEHGNYYVSLSSIYPSQEEVNNLIYYELVDRAGYLHSLFGRSLRKKGVRVLKEGTVLSGKIAGQLVEVGPAALIGIQFIYTAKLFWFPWGGAVMRFTLEVITPVSIGSGELLSQFSDYVYDSGNVYYLDHDSLFRALSEQPMGDELIDSFLSVVFAQAGGNMANRFNLKGFLQDAGLDYKEYAVKKIPVSEEVKEQLHLHIKTGGMPYIPGSTLKGLFVPL